MMGGQSITLYLFSIWALPMLLLGSISSFCNAVHFKRSSFPSGFTFGAATAAYQVEGAVFHGGRGLSIWDTYSHTPGKIDDNSTGDVAIDQYNRYKDDIKLLKAMGMDSYRFSVSWTRIFPSGSPRNGKINREGVAYYNRLIDELLANGIDPYVTLFHWDVPLALELEYGGLLSERIVEDFAAFATVCFELFGDRVKHWITMNEPSTLAFFGYDQGAHAPGRCSPYVRSTCLVGNSGIEPYRAAHNMLLAHAAAARIYKRKFQERQNGKVGITLVSGWFLPFNSSNARDNAAAQRMLDFTLGWFLDPLTLGSYPASMINDVGARLPKFTQAQAIELRGSLDFLGINYYSSYYAGDSPTLRNPQEPRYTTDAGANTSFYNASGHRIGKPSGGLTRLYVYPPGIGQLLEYASNRSRKPIYVTENGYADANNSTGPIGYGRLEAFDACINPEHTVKELNDTNRLSYYQDHLYYVLQAIRNGADVKGYFAWSLADNFEWNNGYTVRFGLYYIDYFDHLKRYAKRTVCWFQKFLAEKN